MSRCLEIRYDGTASPGDVHLLAEDVTGPLARRLDVRVERGTGGGFASCAGFAGATVFDGLLTDLAAGSAGAAGVSTGWMPAADDAQTFRITVEVTGGATSGQTSAATFRWLIVPVQATPAPTTTPTATAPPATTPAVPAATPGPPSPGAAPAADHPDRSTAGRTFGKKLKALVEKTAEVVYEVTARTIRHGGVPIASIVAVVLFILIQNRIDRRDPKLALAPVTGDPYLYFGRDARVERGEVAAHDHSGGGS